MINFMRQHDSAMGCLDIWENNIPKCAYEGGCSRTRSALALVNLVQQVALPSVSGHHPVPRVPH